MPGTARGRSPSWRWPSPSAPPERLTRGSRSARPSASRCCNCLYANVSSTSATSTSARTPPPARTPSRRARRGGRPAPVAALQRGRVLVPADAVDPHRGMPAAVLGREHHHDAAVGAPRGLLARQRIEQHPAFADVRRRRPGGSPPRARGCGPRPRHTPLRSGRSRGGSAASPARRRRAPGRPMVG